MKQLGIRALIGSSFAGIFYDNCQRNGVLVITLEDVLVQALYVLAEHWGTGVGRALWLRGLQHLASLGLETATLWVLAENLRAVRFYQNAGWIAQAESSRTLTRGGCELEEVRYVRAN